MVVKIESGRTSHGVLSPSGDPKCVVRLHDAPFFVDGPSFQWML